MRYLPKGIQATGPSPRSQIHPRSRKALQVQNLRQGILQARTLSVHLATHERKNQKAARKNQALSQSQAVLDNPVLERIDPGN